MYLVIVRSIPKQCVSFRIQNSSKCTQSNIRGSKQSPPFPTCFTIIQGGDLSSSIAILEVLKVENEHSAFVLPSPRSYVQVFSYQTIWIFSAALRTSVWPQLTETNLEETLRMRSPDARNLGKLEVHARLFGLSSLGLSSHRSWALLKICNHQLGHAL